MVQTLDIMTDRSLGTGTNKTQINGGNDYFVQGSIQEIVGIIPYAFSSGATTAGQTYKPIVFLESQDVTPNISPKVYAMAGEAGGLGTTTSGFIPSLDVIYTNIPVKPGNRLQGFGQYLTSNTVAGNLGMAMIQDSNRSGYGRQIFYQVDISGQTPTGTAIGTAAATVNLTDITVTSADTCVAAYGRVYPTTITASQDFGGSFNMSSQNWEAEKLQFPFQPIGSALGALISVADLSSGGWGGSMQKNNVLRNFKPGQNQVVVSSSVSISVAQTGNGTAITGIGFTRPGQQEGSPFSLFIESEDFINCGKDTSGGGGTTAAGTETSFSFSASTNIVTKYVPDAAFKFATGAVWAEDTPSGLGKEDNCLISGPAANTDYSGVFTKRVPYAYTLQKCVLNFAFGLNATANAGNNVNFSSIDIKFGFLFGGQLTPIIPDQTSISTGQSALTGAGSQVFIYEQSYTPNVNIPSQAVYQLQLATHSTTGNGTYTIGIIPQFSYFKSNVTKQFSYSGAYVYGRAV